jgi:3-deoxy-D-manno-octulosonate 8-phosphate phosphatase KdsC-like HAD superfamily phosphatase
MHQAIIVKYLGPTNTKGSRYKATSASGLSKTLGIDHALNGEENARQAAKALADSLKWKGSMVCGSMGDGLYVFVFTGKE